MCLQMCHVTRQVIDNDLPCDHCAVRLAHASKQCVTCRHCRQRAGRPPVCRLTRQSLPAAQTCCHWNADTLAGRVVLDAEDIAPGVMAYHGAGTVAELFGVVTTATPNFTALAGGGVEVDMDELARPVIYGVVASEW